MYPERQELRHQARGKGIGENQTIQEAGVKDQGQLFLKVIFSHILMLIQ